MEISQGNSPSSFFNHRKISFFLFCKIRKEEEEQDLSGGLIAVERWRIWRNCVAV
jgi:hypothetical protein